MLVRNYFKLEKARKSLFSILQQKNSMDCDETEFELEEQFILRLPVQQAAKIREILQTKPEKLKKTLKLDLNISDSKGTVNVGKTKLYAYLKKFPTIIESYKTNIYNDKANMYKTADVCHILECYNEPLEHVKKDTPHGYTAPLKNVKHKRFRKTLVNPEVAEETEVVTKELYYLLSTDLEAASTRFEILYEDGKSDNTKIPAQIETMLFGHVSSDTDSEIEVWISKYLG